MKKSFYYILLVISILVTFTDYLIFARTNFGGWGLVWFLLILGPILTLFSLRQAKQSKNSTHVTISIIVLVIQIGLVLFLAFLSLLPVGAPLWG
jgi:hypothetical protein